MADSVLNRPHSWSKGEWPSYSAHSSCTVFSHVGPQEAKLKWLHVVCNYCRLKIVSASCKCHW
eukprot:1847079-Pleurochrysis_carterae.AAC.1